MEDFRKEKYLFEKGKKLSIRTPFKIGKTYLTKPVVLDSEKNGVWAELALLLIYKKEGYNGIWLDTFHKRFWSSREKLKEFDSLPQKIRNILGSKRGGLWDLIVWKGDKIKFIESKHLLKDKIRTNQIKFMNSLLKMGFDKEDFIVAEWDYKK